MGKIFCVVMALWCAGCFSIPDPRVSDRPLPQTDVEKARMFLDKGQPDKALNVLEKAPPNAETFYLMGCAYIFLRDTKQGIAFFQKALTAQPNYHVAYIALHNIYESQLLELHAQIDGLKEVEIAALQEGKGGVKEIYESLVNLYMRQADLFISQGKTYLLYSNVSSNITAFAGIEAHLRDMQDLFQEKSRVPPEYKQHIEEGKYAALLSEIKEIRQAITKKYITTLVESSKNWMDQGNISRAVEILKEADDHVSRFFAEEKPTSKMSHLENDAEVKMLAKDIVTHLCRYYEEYLKVALENKTQFLEMGHWQEVEEQTHKIEEEILQSWIQLKINALWKFDGIARDQAEEHPEMIALYQLFLQYLPASSKAAKYHYHLAQFYARQNDIEKAKSHILEAEGYIGNYEIKKFLQKLTPDTQENDDDFEDPEEPETDDE